MMPERYTSAENPDAPILHSYSIYKDMYDNNIIFSYRGIVTSDIVTSMLDVMEERLEEDGQNKRTSKKIFNVMLECLTNLYVTDEKLADASFDPSSVLVVKKSTNMYRVSTGTYILASSIQDLKTIIDRVNTMDAPALKKYYQDVLCNEEPSKIGFSTLAVIDLARKSKNKIDYQFTFESDRISFFTLESSIAVNPF